MLIFVAPVLLRPSLVTGCVTALSRATLAPAGVGVGKATQARRNGCRSLPSVGPLRCASKIRTHQSRLAIQRVALVLSITEHLHFGCVFSHCSTFFCHANQRIKNQFHLVEEKPRRAHRIFVHHSMQAVDAPQQKRAHDQAGQRRLRKGFPESGPLVWINPAAEDVPRGTPPTSGPVMACARVVVARLRGARSQVSRAR